MKPTRDKIAVAKIQDEVSGLCYPRDVEDLLKAERARVRRLVNKLATEYDSEVQAYVMGYRKACDDIKQGI